MPCFKTEREPVSIWNATFQIGPPPECLAPTFAVEEAYSTASKVSVQGERVLLEGVTATGMTVQMWLNKATNTIETAYPVGKQW